MRLMDEKLQALSEEQIQEREHLLSLQAKEKKKLDEKVAQLESNLALLRRIVDKKNYEMQYPMPQKLKDHYMANPRSFNIQVLGCRGVGKSTLINKFMRKAKLELVTKRGSVEVASETTFFDITQKTKNIPERYNRVFICDQPGIGGLEVIENDFLKNYGPGKL